MAVLCDIDTIKKLLETDISEAMPPIAQAAYLQAIGMALYNMVLTLQERNETSNG